MAIFISVLEGPTVLEADPIFVTRDRRIIRQLSRELSKLLGGEAATVSDELSRNNERDSQPANGFEQQQQQQQQQQQ